MSNVHDSISNVLRRVRHSAYCVAVQLPSNDGMVSSPDQGLDTLHPAQCAGSAPFPRKSPPSLSATLQSLWRVRAIASSAARSMARRPRPADDWRPGQERSRHDPGPIGPVVVGEGGDHVPLLPACQETMGKNDQGQERNRKYGKPMDHRFAAQWDEQPGMSPAVLLWGAITFIILVPMMRCMATERPANVGGCRRLDLFAFNLCPAPADHRLAEVGRSPGIVRTRTPKGTWNAFSSLRS